MNEEYTCQNPTCESGCLPRPCLDVPCENKCYCKAGFVRENGVCIPRENCLSKIIKIKSFKGTFNVKKYF